LFFFREQLRNGPFRDGAKGFRPIISMRAFFQGQPVIPGLWNSAGWKPAPQFDPQDWLLAQFPLLKGARELANEGDVTSLKMKHSCCS